MATCLYQLFESANSDGKTAVLVFGRFEPPTIGHLLLIETGVKVATENRGDLYVYVSNSQDPRRNPLNVDQKIKFLKMMINSSVPEVLPAVGEVRTFLEAAAHLNREGYSRLFMVAGADRVSEFESLLNKYNGKDFTFASIHVISAGARDPDAEGVVGMSATKMRSAAADGDLKMYSRGLPSWLPSTSALNMMNAVRVGMHLTPVRPSL